MLRLAETLTNEQIGEVTDDTFAPNARPVAVIPTNAALADVADVAEDPAIVAFLDSVVRRLGPLPVAMHGEIRRELRVHLDSLIAAHIELGLEHADATAAAIGQFGDAATIARRFRRSYEQTAPLATPWAAMRETLRVFGLGALAYALLTPPTWNEVYVGFYSTLMLCFFPLFAGVWVGRRTPRRAALGVVYGLIAMATATLPFLVGWGYRNEGTSPSDIAQCAMVTRLLQCFLVWGLLGSLAAAMASRIRWTLREGIDSLFAFAVRGTLFSLLGCAAGYAIHDLRFLSPSLNQTSAFEYLAAPFSIATSSAVLVWLGWQVGKTWPILERWNAKPAAYLVVGAFVASVGSQLVEAAFVRAVLMAHHAPPHFTVNLGQYVLSALRGFSLFALPVIGLATLVSANRARGGNPLLTRAVGLAAGVLVALDEFQIWYFRHHILHGKQLHLPPFFTILPYYLLAVFAAALWANRRRLPFQNRFRAASER